MNTVELPMTVVAEGLQFPEGPIAMPDGSVLLVEIARRTLSRVWPDGRVEVVAETGGGPNGAAFGPDGRVWICNNGGFTWTRRDGRFIPGHQPDDYAGGSIQAVDLATGAVETVYTHCGEHALRGPNDLVFDGDGGFWFTDPGKARARDRDVGGLYYARADGSGVEQRSWGLETPNGVGLSPDGSLLYVAMTTTGRVYRWRLAGPGRFDSPYANDRGALLMADPGENAFDSLSVDGEGHICVATIRDGGITDIAPDGTWTHVPTGDRLTTNICFGGPDLRTAFITCSASGTLVRGRWPRPGLRLHHNPY
ncbi:MAG: SMP-30/gluconolactonase/LRE family protein [Acidimicrobiales bacterium]